MSTEELQSKVQPQVELDTDDVKEEKVELEQEQPKEKEGVASLNVGEVDLGYTDHSPKKEEEKTTVEEIEEPKEEPKQEAQPEAKEKETVEEKKEDNLNQLSDNIQKRIDKLTRNWREAERREKAALDYAKSLQKKYQGTDQKLSATDEKYLKEFDARVDAQREQVKFNLKAAIEANDAEAIMKANDDLTNLAVQKEKAKLEFAEHQRRAEEMKQQQEEEAKKPQQPVENIQNNAPSDKAKDWAAKNSWFGNDKIMTNVAFTIHEDLVGMGIDAESDEYYNEINKRMKDSFPHKFVEETKKEEQRKPVQTVASAGRKQEGRRTVRLTKSQVAIAKKLGVPLEEYAKYVKEVQ